MSLSRQSSYTVMREVELIVRSGFMDAYELQDRVLGTGGQGTVSLGRCRQTSREVAVKIISKSATRAYRNARQEAIMQRSLVHEHVCPLIDVFEDEDNLYLILEFIGGQDLFDAVLTEGALQEASAAALVKQLLEALEYCHKEGVIHRDVKAENILLQPLGKQLAGQAPSLVLADFGLAMAADVADYAPQAVVGTEGYLSPEASDGKYSPASDMWSVGKVLCFMLFGKHVDNWHKEEWAQFSPEARSFVAGLLCTNINDRLSATEALEHSWLSVGDMTKSSHSSDHN
jgi:serine/threonine protein kinase